MAKRTADEEERGNAEEVAGRDVEQRLGSAEELEVVRERQQGLGLAERAGSLELREEPGVLRRRKQAGLRDLREHAQLLDALQQAHRRLGDTDLTALEDAVLVEGDDLWQQKKGEGGQAPRQPGVRHSEHPYRRPV